MNLGEIRAAIYAQSDWEPNTSTEQNARVNGFINRAMDQVALEAPFLFHESEVHFATQADLEPLDGDTVRFRWTDNIPAAGENPWILSRTLIKALLTSGGHTLWPIDRSWDGRIIEIIDSDGTVYRNRIRTITEEAVSGDVYQQITLWKPWPADARGTTSGTQYTYRIYTERYYLPDDLIQLKIR